MAQTGRHRSRRDLAPGIASFDELSRAVVSTTRTARGGPSTGLIPTPARTPIGPRPHRGMTEGLRLWFASLIG
jgi:hypothetical protein